MAKAIVALIPDHKPNRYADNIAEERRLIAVYEERIRTLGDIPSAVESDKRGLAKHRAELERLERKAAEPETPDRIEIRVIYAYEVKDALKARGYWYEPDAAGTVYKPIAGWIKTCDREAAKADIVWLREQGVEVAQG
ncbi:MAG: hypothetical protein C4551_02470 [Bacillota bacterium]|nr:MAG: hypothetical protein C4551_02470 [Bacillota bacterium]